MRRIPPSRLPLLRSCPRRWLARRRPVRAPPSERAHVRPGSHAWYCLLLLAVGALFCSAGCMVQRRRQRLGPAEPPPQLPAAAEELTMAEGQHRRGVAAADGGGGGRAPHRRSRANYYQWYHYAAIKCCSCVARRRAPAARSSDCRTYSALLRLAAGRRPGQTMPRSGSHARPQAAPVWLRGSLSSAEAVPCHTTCIPEALCGRRRAARVGGVARGSVAPAWSAAHVNVRR